MSARIHSPKSAWFRAVLSKRWAILAGLLAVGLGLSAGLARAAPSLQTATPTPTETLPGLPDAPSDGGVIAVENLPVYDGPGNSFSELGGLPYGAFVYPQARTQDGIWLRIDYAGSEGWVYRPMIDMGFDVVRLPVPPGMITPVPGSDNLTLTPSVDVAAPPAEATPVPTPTSEGSLPTPGSEVVVPSTIPEATASPPPATSQAPTPAPIEAPGAMPEVGLGRVVLIIAGVLGLALSARYLFSTRSPVRSRKGQFIIEHCPACGRGRLTLVGTRRTRVVRCDNCRSVLRQLRSGLWRYAVDPLPDRDFAEQFNEQALSEEELIDLAEKRARQRATHEATGKDGE